MKKKIFKKTFITLIPLALVAVPLASCANNTNNSNNINNSNASNGTWTPPIGSENNNYSSIGEIDKKILDDISKPVKVDVLDLSTKTGVSNNQSINNFLNFNLDRNYNNKLITKEGIKSDVYSFVDRLFKINKKIFSINLKDEPVIDVIDKTEANNESDKIVSLNISLNILNESNKKQTFKLLSNSYELESYSQYTLSISFDKQSPSYIINSVNNRYFLGISFDNVNFKLLDKQDEILADFNLNKFSFTQDQFSFIFKKEYLYLSNESDYNDVLNNKSVTDILNSKTDDDFKKELQQEFLKNQENYMNVINVVNDLLSSISSNDSVEVFLSKNTSNIIELLSKFGVVNLNNNIRGLISDLLNKDKTVIQTINDNKDALIDIVKSVVGNNQLILGITQNIIDSVKPGLTQEEQEKVLDQIKSVFNYIGNSASKYLFVVDLVKNLLSGQNIYQFIKTALENKDFETLISNLPQNIKPIVQLLIEVLKNGGTSKGLIDIIFDNKDKFLNLIESLTKNPTIIKIIDIAIKNNSNFTKENIISIISKTLYSLTNGIVHNLDKPISNFDSFSFDKAKNEFTFKFKTIYKINKDFRWELKPLIDLLPDTFSLKDFGLNTADIEKKVESATKGWVTLNKDKGKEWYIFKKSEILGFLPSYVDFKANDSLEFTNEATKQQIWLDPQTFGSKEVFGYSIPTVSGFRFSLPGGVQSIFSQFKDNDGGIDFTKMFSEFLTQEHNFFEKISIIDNKNEISNDLIYNNDLYINNVPFDWKITINKDFKEKVKNNSEKKVIDSYKVKTNNNREITINSYELINNLSQDELGSYLINDYDNKFKGSQFKPFIMLNQISNYDNRTLTVPLKVKTLFISSINVDLNLTNFVFSVSAYLPFKTYTKNKNFINYLESQTGAYLKAGVSYLSLVNETFYNDWIV